MKLEEMTDEQLLDALAELCRKKGWTVQDVQIINAHGELLKEADRRGLKLERGHDGKENDFSTDDS